MTSIKAGDNVRGEYYGNPFVGTVRNVRWHTIDRDTREVWVTFCEPTEVKLGGHAEVRSECLCYVGIDGGGRWDDTETTWVEVEA